MINIQELFYYYVISQTLFAFIIYNKTLNASILEKVTRITIQVNILNVIYYSYKICEINQLIKPVDLSIISSILINLNLVVSGGYIIYRNIVNYKPLYFIYFDSVILHIYNLIFIIFELNYHNYLIDYYYSNIYLSIILYNAWYPLYRLYGIWNYGVNLHTNIGKLYIISIYLYMNSLVYIVSLLKN